MSKSKHTQTMKTQTMKKITRVPKATTVDRMQRISDVMQRTIARLINEEFKDPRVKLVTISSVEVSRDLQHAKVFITVFDETKIEETLEVLNHAAGFFRSHLAHSLKLRYVPKPHFIFDDSVLRGTRMESILSKI